MEFAGYWGLFISSFLAATVLPLSSEGVLYLLLQGDYNVYLLFIIASVGNFFGGVSCYYLGYCCNWKVLNRLMGIKEKKLNTPLKWVEKHGYWMALLCWLPIIGDPIAVGMGVLKSRIIYTFPLMFFGKAIRYGIMILSLKFIN